MSFAISRSDSSESFCANNLSFIFSSGVLFSSANLLSSNALASLSSLSFNFFASNFFLVTLVSAGIFSVAAMIKKNIYLI